MGLGTLPKVLDGSGAPRGGPGRVWKLVGRSSRGWGPSRRFDTGQGTLPMVRDGSRNPPKGLG